MTPGQIKAAVFAVILIAVYGFGWWTRDAFCDAAEAKAELASEKNRHAATQKDLDAAKLAQVFANTAFGWIDGNATAREDIIHEREKLPAAGAAVRCKLGADGLIWLRKIGPD